MKYLIVLSLIAVILVSGCIGGVLHKGVLHKGGFSCKKEVTNFEECIAAGKPAMESYPRQCRYGDQTFTEEVEPLPERLLSD